MITVKEIEMQYATLNENGEVVAFDFDAFNELVNALYKDRTTIRAKNEKEIKAKKEAEVAELASVGKAYYNSLKLGDEFSYKDSKGTVWLAKKAETKSGSDATAACELVNPPEGAKTNKRYPKFHTLVIPADFSIQEVA